jgi:hypothetical protein
MRNKFAKVLSLGMACLTLTLLLNIVSEQNNSKTSSSAQAGTVISTFQDGPWG